MVPSHTGGLGGRPTAERVLWKQWLSPTRFLLAVTIILGVIIILAPTLLRARAPALEARCLAQLEQVGQAITMYSYDHGAYPLPHNWHQAIRPYVGDPANPEEDVIPGSKRDPLKCRADPSDASVSYLYLDRRILDYTMSRLNDSETPLAVDEYFHRYATMVWYDGHTSKMTKQEWAYRRLRQWKVRRDLDNADSFSYELMPGTQVRPNVASPFIEPTDKYIWPDL